MIFFNALGMWLVNDSVWFCFFQYDLFEHRYLRLKEESLVDYALLLLKVSRIKLLYLLFCCNFMVWFNFRGGEYLCELVCFIHINGNYK